MSLTEQIDRLRELILQMRAAEQSTAHYRAYTAARFGAALKIARTVRKLTQHEMGLLAGISGRHVSSIERGARIPSRGLRDALVVGLDVFDRVIEPGEPIQWAEISAEITRANEKAGVDPKKVSESARARWAGSVAASGRIRSGRVADPDMGSGVDRVDCEVCRYPATRRIRVNDQESIRLCDTCSHRALYGEWKE